MVSGKYLRAEFLERDHRSSRTRLSRGARVPTGSEPGNLRARPGLSLLSFSIGATYSGHSARGAWLGGAGPAIVALLVGWIILLIFILPPTFSLSIRQTEDVVGIVFYVIAGLAISILASNTERARRASE